ncbi:hypothetical protein UC8_25430 [Roseimaritima ulvae]|uniref:Uncharacterized protein n=1 Tax=Roseimaritima ulvae TaxID=980254 RepID=A0A5B9QRI6_9BACT|nr:hypothetical protein UC8_25430 [Roseimaritima ulvae]
MMPGQWAPVEVVRKIEDKKKMRGPVVTGSETGHHFPTPNFPTFPPAQGLSPRISHPRRDCPRA